MWRGVLRSVVFVALFVFAIWLVGTFAGFEIDLMSTLIASVLLTVVANLAFGGFRKLTS